MRSRYCSVVLLTLLCALPPADGQEGSLLVLSQTISVPGIQGGFNHMSVDVDGLRLFAAAPSNNTLEVIDLKAGKPWRTLAGERPAAARYAPEFHQLYVSSAKSLSIYDGRTLDVVTSIDLESKLDELHYDARAKRLYVGCMSPGKTGIAVIAIPEGRLVGTIALPDKPQGIAVEQNGSRIYANMPGLKQVAVMDRERGVLLTSWPLADVEGNTPLGLDEAGSAYSSAPRIRRSSSCWIPLAARPLQRSIHVTMPTTSFTIRYTGGSMSRAARVSLT